MQASTTVRIVNQLGIHSRPAAQIVQRILQYESDIYLSCATSTMDIDGEQVASSCGWRVNAKSIMGLLTIAATQGTTILVEAEGGDADEACLAIEELFAAGFGEG
jgi:phosphocarrier protein HPr